ncbi:MAG: cobalamin biosynthesis protein CbiG [Clostridia bacterium]|nr:cobalamin biosynthesis protein CbiG [Clostridia bacterium]NCC43657.1 cobalamin biosynthesis protein CbiG [Clostridia bacterium]
MKIAVIAFTQNGYILETKLIILLEGWGHEVCAYFKSRCTKISKDSKITQLNETLKEWTQHYFPKMDAMIFIGASGIAVRAIAPFVDSKRSDPAIVVLDEHGKFSIPLLSGHLGGANELAGQIAAGIGSQLVVTTATDVNHHFAVDVFAKKNNLWISDMKLAKVTSALILNGARLKSGAGDGFFEKEDFTPAKELDFSKGNSPDGKKGTFWIQLPNIGILHLVPRCAVVGIGCRKGAPKEIIEERVQKVLDEYGISSQAVSCVASIDLKKNEPGLLRYCSEYKYPFIVYSSEELKSIRGNFTPSEFVSKVTGVDNVCERSAFLASEGGIMIIKKQAYDGVTVACALKEWSVDFE